jgi:hypothetical protein
MRARDSEEKRVCEKAHADHDKREAERNDVIVAAMDSIAGEQLEGFDI